MCKRTFTFIMRKSKIISDSLCILIKIHTWDMALAMRMYVRSYIATNYNLHISIANVYSLHLQYSH